MTRTVRLVALAAAGLALAGCTGSPDDGRRPPPGLPSLADVRLVSFDSCDQALTGLRKALVGRVGPYGLDGGAVDLAGGRPPMAVPGQGDAAAERGQAAPDQAEASAQDAQPEHSTTNVHEAGVDEPDMVKTDGKRIVSVVDGTLRVVDAASRRVTGSLQLSGAHVMGGGEANLLLSGDRALVFPNQRFSIAEDKGMPPPTPDQPDQPDQPGPGMPTPVPPVPPMPPLPGPELILVDLAGAPKELARFAIEGRYVDARMVGGTVRVVTASAPQFNFVMPKGPGDEQNALRANREIAANAGIDAWLPRYRTRTERGVSEGRLDCSALIAPARYSATSALTVLSFDLATPNLGTGDPVTIVADGDIVYGTANSLYVGNDLGWAIPAAGPDQAAQQPLTELYKFDTSGPGRPRHVGSGAVPGHLLNQYSLSEYQGKLRVATTVMGETGTANRSAPAVPVSESTVYVLEPQGDKLAVVGQVGGLGKNEQIYAVRFVGPVGYVVTFRRTDPLYTLDLRDPSAPKVAGELKITGYSAYLHPAGDNRIIGVGQEATEQGRTTGTQVSLFDVSDPAKPTRVAQYQVPGGQSEVEYDPHAFLYWAKTQTVVLPTIVDNDTAKVGALVLRLGDAALNEVGDVRHRDIGSGYGTGAVRRSLVIGDALWTLSASGLAANDVGSLAERGWVAFGV